MDSLHLVVGLGNPGADYARTRHNAGFQVVEAVASRWRCGWSHEKKFNARLARGTWNALRVALCEPLSFMNLSGEVVRAVSDYFNVSASQLLVVVDDADLPLGELRLRGQGGSGGHHGLESIMQHLGSNQFARLRLGIGREPAAGRQISSYVLGEFSAPERALFDRVVERAAAAVECWLTRGLQRAMNEFNGVVDPAEAKQ